MSNSDQIQVEIKTSTIVSVAGASRSHGVDVSTLPFVIRVMLENVQRNGANQTTHDDDMAALVAWQSNIGRGIPLHVERVILPDSSGLPVLQGLAALRDAVVETGGDPSVVEPNIPVDVIVDHSLQVDRAGSADAEAENQTYEFRRNRERYRFLKWAQQAFEKVGVHIPGTGIIHQVNLEKIASVIMTGKAGDEWLAFPEFVLGGDSHTPMINALGVLGWGVGGLDAEAAMLGQPYVVPIPEIVGVRLSGKTPVGSTTMDLALTLTQILRRHGVVGSIVEFSGHGLDNLAVPERATLSNMAPEYGATAAFFPIDAKTIEYLAKTRSAKHAEFVRMYAIANDMFRDGMTVEPRYSRIIDIDMSTVTRSVAGPRRPQDRLDIGDVANDFRSRLPLSLAEGGFAANPASSVITSDSQGSVELKHGVLAIAAITACTNTSNPSVMVTAGLLARNAIRLGLSIPDHVKTSMAPGSRVVTRYLAALNLLPSLEALGFNVVGYGCTTCGGKSGPLKTQAASAIDEEGLVAAAALSGNRNFEGRIHRQVRANYIMSPPLVIAYALAGRIDIDLDSDPLGYRPDGSAITLKDIWPEEAEIADMVSRAARADDFSQVYERPLRNTLWNELDAPTGALFPWDPQSAYLVKSPFLALARASAMGDLADRIDGAHALGAFGDSLTTDHISPSGEIPIESSAGRYLRGLGIERADFNTYVGRRCNHEVMVRATFANIRIKNQLVPESEGGVTRIFPEGTLSEVYDAAMLYRQRQVPLVVLGGKEYGTGSSRDWAARGSALLGVRAVLAESYERIHRSNLVAMGILPLVFEPGAGWRKLGLDGSEALTITGIRNAVTSGAPLTVIAEKTDDNIAFEMHLDISTESERKCLLDGGLLAQVLSAFAARGAPKSGLTNNKMRGAK